MVTDESQFEFPLLLVNIGSGVSIIKVSNFNEFQRVSGTMIGGGTLIGLSNLLTGNREFEKIIAKAQTGNNAKVDMLVKDIYGENSPFSLAGDLLASSFAKVANDQSHPTLSVKERYAEEDVLSSLVTMISFNIGQLAFYQSQIHNINNIYFVGSYVRNNLLGMEQICFAVNYKKGGMSKISPRFLTYDGYLGAIGAFMQEFVNNESEFFSQDPHEKDV